MSLLPINEHEILDLYDWLCPPVKPRHYLCVYCGLEIFPDIDHVYISPNCNGYHYYHIQCTKLIIHQSLSLLNQVPKCIIKDCNKSLNISESSQLNGSLYEYYQSKSTQIKQYKQDALLVNAYVRQILHYEHTTAPVPQELITLIHDFYQLVLYQLINCNNCQSMGFLGNRCTECNGTGYTEYCKKCVNGIRQWTENCSGCDGTGSHIVKSSCGCTNTGLYDKTCASCDGLGIRKGAGGRGECSDCDGLGHNKYCDLCDDGTLCVVYNCYNCSGGGKFSKIARCGYCDGDGYMKQRCDRCIRGRTMDIICPKCNLNGSIISTDFNKIVQKQQFCNKCSAYYPKNMMVYWSGCHHTFCYKFIESKYIEDELDAGRIPICPIKDCTHELDAKRLLLPGYWKCIKYKYTKKLKVLKFRQNKFECSICKQWHLKQNILLWSHCGHAYMKQCGMTHISKYIQMGNVPDCCECKQCIESDDIELIAGKAYVHFVDTLKYNQTFKALITRKKLCKIEENEVEKVLKLRNEKLNYNDITLDDKIVDFLNLTSVKIEDIKYLKVIHSKLQVPLFQLYLKDKNTAKKLYAEILNLVKNDFYKSWTVGFWENRRNKCKTYRSRQQPPFRYNRYRYNNINNNHQSNNSNLRSGVFVESGGRLNRAQNW